MHKLVTVIRDLKSELLLFFDIKRKRDSRFLFTTKKTLGEGKGITIAFIGQDGSGKTTVTNDIKKWLSWKLEVKNVYLGSGEHYSSWIKKLYNHIPKSRGGVFKLIRGLLIVVDYKNLSKRVYRKIKRASKLKKQGYIIIFDRYPQMQFSGINDGPVIRMKCKQYEKMPVIGKYIKHCINVEEKNLKKSLEEAPDLVFKLILDPKESIKRKPSENFEMVKRKHMIIKSLDFSSSRVITIDAGKEYDKEIDEIKSNIWNFVLKNGDAGEILNDCISQLPAALNSEVQWLVWKGCYHCKDGFHGKGDIDLLVSESDLLKTRRILKRLGFLPVETQVFFRRSKVEDWIGFESNSGSLIHIHLHVAIVFGKEFVWEYEYAVVETCLLLREKRNDGIYIQNPLLECLIVLCMIEKKCISFDKIQKYRAYFNEKCGSILDDLGLRIISGMNNLISDKIVDFIELGQYEKESELCDFVKSHCIKVTKCNLSRYLFRCVLIFICKANERMIDKSFL